MKKLILLSLAILTCFSFTTTFAKKAECPFHPKQEYLPYIINPDDWVFYSATAKLIPSIGSNDARVNCKYTKIGTSIVFSDGPGNKNAIRNVYWYSITNNKNFDWEGTLQVCEYRKGGKPIIGHPEECTFEVSDN